MKTRSSCRSFTLSLLVPCALLFALWGCGDDTVSGLDEDPPAAPSMEEVEMDFSVFDEAEGFGQFSASETDEALQEMQPILLNDDQPAYEQAAIFAFMADMWFQTMGQFPNIFFSEQQWGEPDIQGDTWVWDWSFSYEGESLSMVVTAEPRGDERHWELRYTVEGTDHDIDNEVLIAAQERLDGSGGAWQMFDMFDEETDDPAFEVSYELDEELTTEVDMRFEGSDVNRFLYERDGQISSLIFWNDQGQQETELEWNNETGTGWIQSPDYRSGQQVCWDENFEDTECS